MSRAALIVVAALMLAASPCGLGLVAPAAAQESKAPLYYQDPDGKPDYSPVPKKTTDGRDYVAVFEDTPAQGAAPPPAATAKETKGRILYYRNPMGLPDTSPVPKKDSMGMDYIPVYGNEAETGVVNVAPGRLQLLGVRTAPVEQRPAVSRAVRATGTLTFDERRLSVITTKVEGWIEQLEVAATGEAVKKGQVLAWLYSPLLVSAEEEFLLASRMPASHGGGSLGAAALQRLRALDVPEDEIARLRRSGKASRRIAIRATADGVVTDKPVVAGMRIMPGEPLRLSTGSLCVRVERIGIIAIPGLRSSSVFMARSSYSPRQVTRRLSTAIMSSSSPTGATKARTRLSAISNSRATITISISGRSEHFSKT